jgi:hypothetical protein
MKRLTQPWRPCRDIGTQPAGNAACSPRPEVVIAARVIPAPSPRWTFRGKGETQRQPAELSADDRWGDCLLSQFLPGRERFHHYQLQGQGFRRKSLLRTKQLFPQAVSTIRVST